MKNLRTRDLKRCAAPAVAAILLGTLAACGGSDDNDSDGSTLEGMSGTEIRDAAKEAMRDLEGLHFVATLPYEGQPMRVDTRVDADGDCQATLEMSGGSAELAGDAEATYVKADAAFWTAIADENADQLMTRVGEKWAKFTPEEFANFCSLDKIVESVTEGEEAEIEVGDTVDHDGVEAQALTTTKGGVESEVLIAYEAPHHILHMTNEQEQATLEVDEFDEKVEPSLPDEGDYVDLTQGPN